MGKRQIFDFLRDLRDHNSKEWMDEHRDRYHAAKETWLEETQGFLDRLKQHDPSLGQLRPKDCIMRINNNNVFHPDKPTYKDHFGFDPNKGRDRVSYYVHVSPSGSFIAGGMWHPSSEKLKMIREAVDYDASILAEMDKQGPVYDFYGGLAEDEDALKTSPRDYPADHPHIGLLRRKNFVVMREVTQQEVLSDGFTDLVEEGFVAIRPLLGYLQEAIDFTE